jgi:hypothetical protein
MFVFVFLFSSRILKSLQYERNKTGSEFCELSLLWHLSSDVLLVHETSRIRGKSQRLQAFGLVTSPVSSRIPASACRQVSYCS